MQLRWIKDTHDLPDTIVLPLLATDGQQETLAQIAGQYGLAPGRLGEDLPTKAKSITPLFTSSDRLLLVLGLGEEPGLGEAVEAFRTLAHSQRQLLRPELGLDLSWLPEKADASVLVDAACNGLALGTYDIGRFQKAAQEDPPHPLNAEQATLCLYGGEQAGDALKRSANRGLLLAETQMRIFDLVNAPSNRKRPEDLAAWAEASGKAHGFRVDVLQGPQLEQTGLHGLLAVNRGSEYPAAFIIMEYKPETLDPSAPVVGLVGKGVTFDTGGLSIKPSQNMHLMKSDMGGAAAVLGALEAAARMDLPVHLIGMVPATDNCVDALSIKPGDVIDSYAGKTIEVIDTDAEGRLILADGLAYLNEHYQPDIMIDLATLTGSAVRALGYEAAALFSANETLAHALLESGQRSGEKCWRLPLWKAYGEDLKSDVADIRNLGRKPVAGAIFAAKFLESFTNGHPAWAHLDIAGVAIKPSAFAKDRSATAFGVRLLVELLSHLPNRSQIHQP